MEDLEEDLVEKVHARMPMQKLVKESSSLGFGSSL